MFHVISNIFWSIFQPVQFVILLILLGIVSALWGWRSVSVTLSAFAFLILAVGGWTSTGALMLQPLEQTYSRPAKLPEDIAGIIVLGGGFEGAINLARGGYELNSSGDRFVEAAILARQYPDTKIIISGGNGSLFLDGETDASSAEKLLTALGVERERLILEGQSRNTYENAMFTRELLLPTPGQRWLLVTSAFHMPRSVGVFSKVGFNVIPWPSDYRTTGLEKFGLTQDNFLDSIRMISTGLREWIGLYTYKFTGRIDEF